MTNLSKSIAFQTEQFDYTSDLPDEYNAGNRFYGRDVAAYLAHELTTHGFPADFLDEDWGWLVSEANDAASPFQVAIYNLSEHREGGRPGANEWGLWVRAFERKKVLGLFSKNVEVTVPPTLEAAVVGAIQALGANPTEWKDGS
jgi:hypothetical protein